MMIEIISSHITEYGYEWLQELLRAVASTERPPMLGGVTNGLSQFALASLIDHVNGKTSFTMPTTVALALATTAPTSTTTGGTLVEANYTNYAEQTIAGAGWNAATAATPSVATNNGAITFPGCGGGTNTIVGFMVKNSSTIGLGQSLWYGTTASTVISTTQTPPTVANGNLSVQINDT